MWLLQLRIQRNIIVTVKLVCLVQAAMNNMTTELMLLGVATLILVAFQPNIGRICGKLVLLFMILHACVRNVDA